MNQSAAHRLDDCSPPPLTPPLKWAGGKRWLVPHLISLYHQHRERKLVEPFAGGLAVALGLAPERALLNDLNPHLINFYQHLRAGLTMSIEMQNDRAHYFALRTRFNSLVTLGETVSNEAAQIFYYLNRTAFNGLCRFNSKGGFNVPFGTYAKITYAKDFLEYRDTFSRWEFCCKDFGALTLSDDDFIYADPPYDVEFTKYSREDFSWKDQERLAHWLAERKGPVVASNQATPRIMQLYQESGFTIKTLSAPRRISCTGDRTPALEMLATKNL